MVALWTAAASAQEAQPIRVGVVAYEDFGDESAMWEQVLRGLSRTSEPPLTFEVAVGTYGDLLHWMRERSIDVGVVTAGVLAESVHLSLVGEEAGDFRYLATWGVPPAESKWATQERKQPGHHFQYQAVCVAPADSPIRTLDGLQAAWDETEILMVHPLSVSGRIAPEFALRRVGLVPDPRQVRYTHSHTESLRRLANREKDSPAVAFVWDDALRDEPKLAGRLRKIDIPELDRLRLPQIAVVARRDLPQLSTLRDSLVSYRDKNGQAMFLHVDDWRAHYRPVLQWSDALGVSSLSDLTQNVSLDEIGSILLHSCRARGETPRLAVVLSGGGAKCSYQVGALSALEEMLERLREENEDCPLDINLVVGTSGGAINSTPVAMRVTATKEGRKGFEKIWTSLDQRDLVRPSWIVRANIGVWFALFIAACWLGIARRAASQERWPVVWAVGLIALAAIPFVLAYLEWKPWSYLGANHFWHHLWLWGTFGFVGAGWCLLVLGLGVLVAFRIAERRGRTLQLPHRAAAWVLAVCLFGLPLAQLLTVLFFQDTLSTGAGMEEMLAEKFPVLIDRHLQREGKPPLNLDPSLSQSERLRAASRGIFERKLFERDVVITGNCLAQTTSSLPSDLYFFVKASSASPEAPFGPRGVDLRKQPETLLDVVLGSGTIFPVFPSRTLRDFPEEGEQVELIDGGFAHNSPIEAAVLWGATHVVLIEATPQKRLPRRNFAENAAAAFVHLHRQTQLVDARSKKQVVVFTLSPEPPHLCVLDFADNLLAASIQRGYEDAAYGARFRKELGEPTFTRVESADSGATP